MHKLLILTCALLLSLTACADTPALTPQAAPALEMRVRSTMQSPETSYWLRELKNVKNYRTDTGQYSLMKLASSGRVQDLSRHLNLQLEAVLAGVRVTGDRALLEAVYKVMEAERKTLKDNDGDGYLDWMWVPGAKSAGSLDYTDRHVMEEIMAHSIVAEAAYAFKLNRGLDPKYSQAYKFWTRYLRSHYEAKWQKRNGRAGYPVLTKPLMHPTANNVQYYHYLYKLTGRDAYRVERDRQVVALKLQLMEDGRALVWSHFVNQRGQRARFWSQPNGYTGESLSALADLGLEGVLDNATMARLARTVTDNLLDGKSPGLLAADVTGGDGGTFYSPLLKKRVQMNPAPYPRGAGFFLSSRGYLLLSMWDKSGEIVRVAQQVHRSGYGWPAPAAGVLLGGAR